MTNDENRMKNSSTSLTAPSPAAPRTLASGLRHSAFLILHSSFFLLLAACSSLKQTSDENDASVIYALPPAAGFTSPLASSQTPTCPALEFRGSSLQLDETHQRTLAEFRAAAEKSPSVRYLIVGYAPPDLTEDHARSLSQRRALGVRQHLIEAGLDPARFQCIGLGNDFASSQPARHVVLIFRQS
jgi:hypothetical protein